MNNRIHNTIKGLPLIIIVIICGACFLLMGGGATDKADIPSMDETSIEGISLQLDEPKEERIVESRDVDEKEKAILKEQVQEKKLKEVLLNKKLDLHKAKYYKVIQEN